MATIRSLKHHDLQGQPVTACVQIQGLSLYSGIVMAGQLTYVPNSLRPGKFNWYPAMSHQCATAYDGL